MKILKHSRMFRLMASVKLAVPLMLALVAACATGTIYESRYNAQVASLVVYRSHWFEALLVLLWLNIFCATVIRFPFRRSQLGFVTTHAGLLTLIAGGVVTSRLGIDGQLYVEEGSADRVVVLSGLVLKSIGTDSTEVHATEIPRDLNTRGSEAFQAINAKLERRLAIQGYQPFVRKELGYGPAPGDAPGEAALRVALKNGFARSEVWLQSAEQPELQLGPVRLRLVREATRRLAAASARSAHETPRFAMEFRRPPGGGPALLELLEQGRTVSRQALLPGRPAQTPWMGLSVELLESHERSVREERIVPVELSGKGPLPPSAIRVNDEWLAEGDEKLIGGVSGGTRVYYGPPTLDLPFTVTLEKFHKVDYPGTDIPASFESQVRLGGQPRTELISMNQPLKRDGFTIYQSSYSLRPGRPPVSVFSVNRDPGRPVKYAGALVLTVGIALFTLMRTSWYRARTGAAA